jgi:hypothetical protein
LVKTRFSSMRDVRELLRLAHAAASRLVVNAVAVAVSSLYYARSAAAAGGG